MIGAPYGVVHVQRRRHGSAHGLAIVHRHASVRPLGHDLDRATIDAIDANPHEPVAEITQRRFHHRAHAGGDAVIHDQPGFVESFVRFAHALSGPAERPVSRKERARSGPTLTLRSRSP